MPRVRVIRIIEHDYESQEDADRGLAAMYLSGTGQRIFAHETIRWATLYPAVLFNQSEEEKAPF